MTKTKDRKQKRDILIDSFINLRGYFLYAALFSASLNLLMLTPILYMLQVYDRVVSSGSMTTLSMLTLLMILLLGSSGGFEWVRGKLLIAANARLEKDLREPVSITAFKSTLTTGSPNSSAQAMNDLIGLRQFATGNGIFALMDAPWTPIYIIVMFMFHPLFGIAAIITSLILILLAITTQKLTSRRLQSANDCSRAAQTSFVNNLRNAEVIHGMGMAANIRKKDGKLYDRATDEQSRAAILAGRLASLSKSFRLISQSLLLGLGAYLALQQQISPGMMIAGSLLLGRALAPIDMMVGTWKNFVEARAQFQRLRKGLEAHSFEDKRMSLPAPEGNLSVAQLFLAPPLSKTPCLKGVSFDLRAGEALGVIGPSGAGKTSLLRGILGVWNIAAGSVRLDNADINSWSREELGPYLGYLPQDIELFSGTIAENICRFSEVDPEKVISASQMAGIHEMILKLPDSYDTKINPSAGILSAGQRQRLGLARAIYSKPKLILLDEPNSNLDEEGDRNLLSALQHLKGEGSTIIVITHRTPILALVDKVLLLQEGITGAFGGRDEVLKALQEQNSKVTSLPHKAAPN